MITDIGPFEGKSFEEAIDRLSEYTQLLENFTDVISRHTRFFNVHKVVSAKKRLKGALKEVHSYDDFQRIITCGIFLDMIISSSIDSLTTGGLENLEDKPYVYISNHRDIILDTALLDYVLNNDHRQMCEMLIGDNLLVNQFVTDLFKVNGAITVKRSYTSSAELREVADTLSSYIYDCITRKQKSIWVAQKTGRSKDGNDNTSTAVLKMLSCSAKAKGMSFSDFISQVKIVPVSISYEFDPCDLTKSNSEIKKLKVQGCYGVYKKKKYADMLDMVKGLRQFKGNVHIQVGQPLNESVTDVISAAREIDRQIHLNYKLWDTNWYCYDKLNNSTENSDKYQSLNIKAFEKKYADVPEDVALFVFNQYANPVRSYLSEQ